MMGGEWAPRCPVAADLLPPAEAVWEGEGDQLRQLPDENTQLSNLAAELTAGKCLRKSVCDKGPAFSGWAMVLRSIAEPCPPAPKREPIAAKHGDITSCGSCQ